MQQDKVLDDVIIGIIQKDKQLTNKEALLKDMEIINNPNANNKEKELSYDRLIKYLSYLPKWDEELIAYLGNRFFQIKVNK
ncbi:MAG: hypothetical protein SFY32_03425 [Bacteroidota bacterium]|nr:hypothetical protein [Bacteroidota bacterium]